MRKTQHYKRQEANVEHNYKGDQHFENFAILFFPSCKRCLGWIARNRSVLPYLESNGGVEHQHNDKSCSENSCQNGVPQFQNVSIWKCACSVEPSFDNSGVIEQRRGENCGDKPGQKNNEEANSASNELLVRHEHGEVSIDGDCQDRKISGDHRNQREEGIHLAQSQPNTFSKDPVTIEDKAVVCVRQILYSKQEISQRHIGDKIAVGAPQAISKVQFKNQKDKTVFRQGQSKEKHANCGFCDDYPNVFCISTTAGEIGGICHLSKCFMWPIPGADIV